MDTRNATVQETQEYIREMARDGRGVSDIEHALKAWYRMNSDCTQRVKLIPADVKIEDVTLDVIYSQTGYARGSGSQPYRWVAGLSNDERAAVKAGHLVLVKNDNTRSCDWYEVTYRSGKYGHRVPVRADLLIA